MAGGGSGSQSTQTIQSAEPWKEQKPYLETLFKKAEANLNAPGPTYFPSAVSATATPETLAAQTQLKDAATAQQGVADSTAQSNAFNQNEARYVESNPYLQQAIDAAIRPVTQQFERTGGTQSQIRDAAQGAGQYGGTRQGVVEGIATGDYLSKVGDISSTMASQGYQAGLDASTRANAIAPQVSAMQTAPAATLDTVGQQKQAYEQQLIDDAIAKHNFEQNLPGAKLAQYQNLIQGGFGGSSTGTTVGPGGMRPSGLAGMAGGAMSGFTIGSNPALMAATGGMSGMMGAGIGALLSFL